MWIWQVLTDIPFSGLPCCLYVHRVEVILIGIPLHIDAATAQGRAIANIFMSVLMLNSFRFAYLKVRRTRMNTGHYFIVMHRLCEMYECSFCFCLLRTAHPVMQGFLVSSSITSCVLQTVQAFFYKLNFKCN